LADLLSVVFENASEKVSPSVVPIFSEEKVAVTGLSDDPFRDFFGDDFFKRFFEEPRQNGKKPEEQKQIVHGLGSGVIVSADGLILTNNHVIDGAEKLTVVLPDKRRFLAKVMGTDPQTDVAVIKIDARNLPAASLGNSDAVKIGQWVIAIGNPFELLHTVTAGIISAKGRSSVGLADYEDFMQTDASINPGNSGGALADLDGNVIGINTAISSPSGGSVGIGFAIPINMAKHVMEELIQKGKVSRGYIGLVLQDIDENLAKAMKFKTTEGALVGDVVSGGPGDKAGIKTGDVIIELDGRKIFNSADLRNRVAQMKPKTEVNITLLRDGKEIQATSELGERPPKGSGRPSQKENQKPDEQANSKLGISIQNLTADAAGQLGYKNETGVVITDVYSGSPAEDAGLKTGDLIKEVDKKAVVSVREFNDAVGKAGSGDTVSMLVRREQNTFFLAIQIP
jgi:serine protease Do